MKDQDSELIWEAYDPNSRWSEEGFEELDYEKIPFDELRQLNPEEASKALEKLTEIDDLYQRHNRAFTDPSQRKLIDNARNRMKILRDIIDRNGEPEPQYTADDYKKMREEEKRRRDEKYRAVMKKRHPEDPRFQD